jgi:hypothetical protein
MGSSEGSMKAIRSAAAWRASKYSYFGKGLYGSWGLAHHGRAAVFAVKSVIFSALFWVRRGA